MRHYTIILGQVPGAGPDPPTAVRLSAMALLPPGTGGSGIGGTVAHNDLPGRDQANAHPISAITGLEDRLNTHDATIVALGPLRFFYTFSGAISQDIFMPQPLDTISLVVVMVRVSDGAMIEPEITYFYDPGPERYIYWVRLGFTPAISGQYVIHVIR